MTRPVLRTLSAAALAFFLASGTPQPSHAQAPPCPECLSIRVGPATVVRGPFPDELDAPFAALRLADGSFRGFSANGSTYVIDGTSLWDMAGPRREVIEAGPPGSLSECGRWLTSIARAGTGLLGFVHQEMTCDYNLGRTDKSMAIATSSDNGLSWTDLGTVITGTELPQPGQINGEGDCTMVDGLDGYLYAYCLRNTDWQTIVARARPNDPTNWRKYYEGAWTEPGLGGKATAIGFVGHSVGYLRQPGWFAALTTDPWFGGLRLSLSTDMVSFVDVAEPLLAIDGSDWDRPADTDLIAYTTILNPDDGSNAVNDRFLLSYIYVPPGKGFESRYLVHHEVTLSLADRPQAAQVGAALTRWSHPGQQTYITSTGPLTGDRLQYRNGTVVAYMLTSPPEDIASIKLEECSSDWPGHLDQMLAEDGSCGSGAYARERTAGWLYITEQPGSVPVFRCHDAAAQSHFASSAPDCEGLGDVEFRLGYGLAP